MPNVPITRFQAEISKNYSARGRAPKTVKQIDQVLQELGRVGVSKTHHLGHVAITDWIAAWPERTPVTFRSHLRCLSAICTRAVEWGYLRRDPFEKSGISDWIRADSRPAPPKRRWSKPAEQIRAVLALADEEALTGGWEACRLRAYVHTQFLTGGRPGEIQRLRIEDFSRSTRTIEICPHYVTGKGGRKTWWKPKTLGSAAILPIGSNLVDLLSAWSRRVRCDSRRGRLRIRDCEWLFPGKMLWGPWVGGGAGETPLDQVKALGVRAGVPGLTCKAARKGIGTYREIGLTPQGRREYFRHSDDATGDLYDEHDIDSRRGDADRIERFFYGERA